MGEQQVPAGYVEVPRARFYELLNAAAKLDPMPRNTSRDFVAWETRDGLPWGWSTPGYASPFGTPYRYAVKQA